MNLWACLEGFESWSRTARNFFTFLPDTKAVTVRPLCFMEHKGKLTMYSLRRKLDQMT